MMSTVHPAKQERLMTMAKSNGAKPARRSPLARIDHSILTALVILLVLYTLFTFGVVSRVPSVNDHHVFFHQQHQEEGALIPPPIHKEPSLIEKELFPIHATNDLEEIVHPGVAYSTAANNKLARTVKVPKFWDSTTSLYPYGPDGIRSYLGNHGERLITPEEASNVGSWLGSLETIYISIASYRDYECGPTVEDLYARAKHPERIRVAIISQRDFEKDPPYCAPPTSCEKDSSQKYCEYQHLVDFFEIDAKFSVGPVFARHLGSRMYRGEYFAMQVDSHVRFTEGWDDDLVQHWKSAKNEMCVLTAYLSDITGSIDPETHKSKHRARPIMCKTDFEGVPPKRHLRHGQQPEGISFIRDQPTLEPFWAAGFSFARGHFVAQIPYDQYLPMVFQGEEISIGLRAFTYGYDFYTIPDAVCFHMYAIKENAKVRKKVPLFWEHSKMYQGVEKKAFTRLNAIIGMGDRNADYDHTDEDQYGLGKVRTTQKFFDTFGIHTETQTVEDNLCRFVGKPMMNEFLPHLRQNRMGINYDEITYKFVDHWKQKKK